MESKALFTAAGMGRVFGTWDNRRISRLDRLYLIRGGKGYYTVDGNKYPFCKDQLYYLPWTVDYILEQDEDDPLDHIFLDFIQCSPYISKRILNLSACDDPCIIKIASFLCDMTAQLSKEFNPGFWLAQESPGPFGDYDGMMQSCLSALMRRLEQLFGIPHASDAADIYRAVSYIHEHYTEPIDVNTLAAQACLNKRYFIGKFHSVIGETPYQYLQSVRYDMAMVMHRFGMPLQKAAEKVGFASPSSVYRMRKQNTKNQ
ncbi:MAG: helix-turn-helix transcriptional regulator [Clostridia bacterium]|nr:helix-turn-helix transcriptional regulator [Clostridia bacterium]